MRAYRDPTADMAIANVMREMKRKKGRPKGRKARGKNDAGNAGSKEGEGQSALPFHTRTDSERR